MTFIELTQMVREYRDQYNCSIDEAIYDLEFDGPGGSISPSTSDLLNVRLLAELRQDRLKAMWAEKHEHIFVYLLMVCYVIGVAAVYWKYN